MDQCSRCQKEAEWSVYDGPFCRSLCSEHLSKVIASDKPPREIVNKGIRAESEAYAADKRVARSRIVIQMHDLLKEGGLSGESLAAALNAWMKAEFHVWRP